MVADTTLLSHFHPRGVGTRSLADAVQGSGPDQVQGEGAEPGGSDPRQGYLFVDRRICSHDGGDDEMLVPHRSITPAVTTRGYRGYQSRSLVSIPS